MGKGSTRGRRPPLAGTPKQGQVGNLAVDARMVRDMEAMIAATTAGTRQLWGDVWQTLRAAGAVPKGSTYVDYWRTLVRKDPEDDVAAGLRALEFRSHLSTVRSQGVYEDTRKPTPAEDAQISQILKSVAAHFDHGAETFILRLEKLEGSDMGFSATGPLLDGSAVITATSNVLDVLTEEEMTGALAHELAHLEHRDSLRRWTHVLTAYRLAQLKHNETDNPRLSETDNPRLSEPGSLELSKSCALMSGHVVPRLTLEANAPIARAWQQLEQDYGKEIELGADLLATTRGFGPKIARFFAVSRSYNWNAGRYDPNTVAEVGDSHPSYQQRIAHIERSLHR